MLGFFWVFLWVFFWPFLVSCPFFNEVSELFALLGYFFVLKAVFSVRFDCFCWRFLPPSAEVLWPITGVGFNLRVRLSIPSGFFQDHFWDPFYFRLFFSSRKKHLFCRLQVFFIPFFFLRSLLKPLSVLTLRRWFLFSFLSPFFPLPDAF